MSAMLITTGCAGSTGAATASQTTSQAENTVAADQSGDSAQTDNAAPEDQKSASGNSEGSSAPKQKSDSSAENSGSSAETTEELKTVEPSAYAGQTVYGKVTAINDSQVTVTLGTYKEKHKKSSSGSGTTDSNTNDSGATDSNTADTNANNSGATDSNANTPSTSTAPANGSADTAEANRGKTGQGKKSHFTSSGEQMTVTIPDSLSGVEIKENYVLSITLDESGNVTAVEVKSKGRSKSGSDQPAGGQMPEKGKRSGSDQTTDAGGTTGENGSADASGTTQL